MTVLKSYEALMSDRLDEIKADAATADTYGDFHRLDEAIVDLLDEIRGYIRNSRSSVRSCRRDVSWHESYIRRNPDTALSVEAWQRGLQRAETRLSFECAMREELKAGRREMKRQERDTQRRLTRILAEIDATKAARGES